MKAVSMSFGQIANAKNGASSLQKSRAWIELDMENLRHNVRALRSLLPEKCELMPSVKANAHGHGAAEICRELNNIGVRAFCVASVSEGIELREQNIEGEILVFGYTHPESFPLLRLHRLTQTVIDLEYAEKLNAFGDTGTDRKMTGAGKKVAVHVKIDTGMNRLGEPAGNTGEILKMFGLKNLEITGVYSHFYAQNENDRAHRAVTQRQLEKFNRVMAMIEENGHGKPKTHLQGSFGIFSLPGLECDFARPGMALYGVYRNNGDAMNSNALRPVLTLKARVAAVKEISAGDAVGYELAFVASRDMKIAALSIGYADGLPHALSCGKGRVLVAGAYAPILGNICMDQTIVDVTGVENVRQGDVAVVIGRDGDEEITAYDVAEQAGTIPNEIVGRLGSRLCRQKGTYLMSDNQT